MTQPLLSLDSVSRAHPITQHPILTDVTFSVAGAEVVVLLGPNGSGKTTTLRLIAGLDAPDRGRIAFTGVTMTTGHPPSRRGIGMVFQEGALFPHMTVAENVAAGLRSCTPPERARRVADCLAAVGMSASHAAYPHTLSGGQQQRVAIARALAPQPRLLLLDEPFSSLDPAVRRAVRADIVASLRQSQTAAVLVTHDVPEALAIADRIVLLDHGRIRQIGTPHELYNDPADWDVAQLLGPAIPLAADAGGMTILGKAPLRLPLTHVPPQHALVVRCEDLVIVPDTAPNATVTATTYEGATYQHSCRCDDGSTIVCRSDARAPHAVGERISVQLRTDRSYTALPRAPLPHHECPADAHSGTIDTDGT